MPPKQVIEIIAETIMQALDWILPGLRRHSERVSALSVETGRRLGLSEHVLDTLQLAARLHDVGILTNFLAFKVVDAGMLPELEVLANLSNRTTAAMLATIQQILLECDAQARDQRNVLSLVAGIVSAAELYDNARKGLRPFPRPVSRHNLEREMTNLSGTRLDPTAVPIILQVARELTDYCDWTSTDMVSE